jgi:TatD DNase family protein
MNLIDIHAHLDFKDYDADRAAVIQRTREAECGVINVGVDLATSKAVIKLAEENDLMWATVGFHPIDCQGDALTMGGVVEFENDWRELEKLAAHDKVVAIGECGLDYYRLERNIKSQTLDKIKERQIEIFEKQIELAVRLDKPLMLHVRDAYNEVWEILKRFSMVRGNVHCFTGDWEQAQKFLDLGLTLSFTGIITFANQYDEVLARVPLDKIMAETDSPLLAPAPYRGQRNEPLYVAEVVKKIAEIKDLPLPEVAAALLNNAIAFIGDLC